MRLAETKLQQKRRRTISTFSVCVFFLCCRTHPHIFCAVTHVDVSLPAFFLKNQNWRDRESTGALNSRLCFPTKSFLYPRPTFPSPLLHFSDLNNGNEPSNHLPHKISVKFPRFKKAHDALYPPPYARRARAPLCRILKSGDEFMEGEETRIGNGWEAAKGAFERR